MHICMHTSSVYHWLASFTRSLSDNCTLSYALRSRNKGVPRYRSVAGFRINELLAVGSGSSVMLYNRVKSVHIGIAPDEIIRVLFPSVSSFLFFL